MFVPRRSVSEWRTKRGLSDLPQDGADQPRRWCLGEELTLVETAARLVAQSSTRQVQC